MIEAPHFLLSKGKEAEARKALQSVRSDGSMSAEAAVDEEYDNLLKDQEKDVEQSWAALFHGTNRARTSIAFVCACMLHLQLA